MPTLFGGRIVISPSTNEAIGPNKDAKALRLNDNVEHCICVVNVTVGMDQTGSSSCDAKANTLKPNHLSASVYST